MSVIILNVGDTGSGKNYRSLMLRDEMPEKTPYAIDTKGQYFKADPTMKFLDPKKPLGETAARVINGLVFVDEAAIILNLCGSNQAAIEALSQCRHNETVTVLNFHSLRLIPEYVVDFWDIMILGHSASKRKHAAKFESKEDEIINALEVLHKNLHNPHMAINIFRKPLVQKY